jgi:hypothetical protein
VHIVSARNVIADALSRLEMKDYSDESILDKPTPKFMVAIISRTKIIKDELSPQMVLKWLNHLI